MTVNKPLPFPGPGRQIHMLIDPDKWTATDLETALVHLPERIGTLIVGGTYIYSGRFGEIMDVCVQTGRPVGNYITAGPVDSLLDPRASFALLPVVINAPTPRFITEHICMAASTLDRFGIPTFAMAYLQLDGGVRTSAEFFTQTQPLPRNDSRIITVLSLVARFLGLQGVYLEAGSGATTRVRADEVEAARQGAGTLPIIVGGGIRSVEDCEELLVAGADAVVVGTACEKDRGLGWLRQL